MLGKGVMVERALQTEELAYPKVLEYKRGQGNWNPVGVAEAMEGVQEPRIWKRLEPCRPG